MSTNIGKMWVTADTDKQQITPDKRHPTNGDKQQPPTATPDNQGQTTTTNSDTRRPGTSNNHQQRHPTARDYQQPPTSTTDNQAQTTTINSDTRQPGTSSFYQERHPTTRDKQQPPTVTSGTQQWALDSHQPTTSNVTNTYKHRRPKEPILNNQQPTSRSCWLLPTQLPWLILLPNPIILSKVIRTVLVRGTFFTCHKHAADNDRPTTPLYLYDR
jgi:hypothetical protein